MKEALRIPKHLFQYRLNYYKDGKCLLGSYKYYYKMTYFLHIIKLQSSVVYFGNILIIFSSKA